jgi:hypothetical protein
VTGRLSLVYPSRTRGLLPVLKTYNRLEISPSCPRRPPPRSSSRSSLTWSLSTRPHDRRSHDELEPPRLALHRRAPARLTSCAPRPNYEASPPVRKSPSSSKSKHRHRHRQAHRSAPAQLARPKGARHA